MMMFIVSSSSAVGGEDSTAFVAAYATRQFPRVVFSFNPVASFADGSAAVYFNGAIPARASANLCAAFYRGTLGLSPLPHVILPVFHLDFSLKNLRSASLTSQVRL